MMQLDRLSFRTAPPVAEQPSMGLLQWRVLELADGARVLAGMLPEGMTLRITSPITGYQSQRFTTSSGRIYHLIGAPASDVRVLFSIAEHLLLSGFDRARDVTGDFEVAMQARDDVPAEQGALRFRPSGRA